MDSGVDLHADSAGMNVPTSEAFEFDSVEAITEAAGLEAVALDAAGLVAVAAESSAPDSVAPDSVAPDSVAPDSVAPESAAVSLTRHRESGVEVADVELVPCDGVECGGAAAVSSVMPSAEVRTESSFEADEDAERVDGIWREWLTALANDSEAAMAAAMTYRQFSDDVRDEWVNALASDVDHSGISRVAVFAPLLAVETDPARRLRIAQLLQPGLKDVPAPGGESYSRGKLASGSVVATIVCPLYLDFVQVLACCYVPGERFLWVRHDPIAHRDQCKAMSSGFTGVTLERTPRNVLVDELAQTVVAVHRRGELLPEPLCLFAHLFTPGY
jgi:hypothetical protein